MRTAPPYPDQDVVVAVSHDARPVDSVGVAELVVLLDAHAAALHPRQRPQPQRLSQRKPLLTHNAHVRNPKN